ncbi:hypothetical protein BDQ17DRAFT_1408851 [Cyathus striatus]|nr:hypothetical protein BDQ17DRAFT_1408851 [Cyathus striatus]
MVEIDSALVGLFSKIPEDIFPAIFEFAAYQDRRSAARSLLLVSRVVKRWIEKLVYEAVILHTGDQAHSFSSTLRSCSHIPPLVHALALPDKCPKELVSSIEHILTTCRSITALYWNRQDRYISEDGSRRRLRSSIVSLPLKILYLAMSTFINRGQDILQVNHGLTHLGLLNDWKIHVRVRGNARIMEQSTFEHLTHLAIRTSSPKMLPGPSFCRVLESSTNLKACVVYLEVDDGADYGSGIDELSRDIGDERLVILRLCPGVEEWLSIFEEKNCCYAKIAERVVEKRRMERQRRDI